MDLSWPGPATAAPGPRRRAVRSRLQRSRCLASDRRRRARRRARAGATQARAWGGADVGELGPAAVDQPDGDAQHDGAVALSVRGPDGAEQADERGDVHRQQAHRSDEPRDQRSPRADPEAGRVQTPNLARAQYSLSTNACKLGRRVAQRPDERLECIDSGPGSCVRAPGRHRSGRRSRRSRRHRGGQVSTMT